MWTQVLFSPGSHSALAEAGGWSEMGKLTLPQCQP